MEYKITAALFVILFISCKSQRHIYPTADKDKYIIQASLSESPDNKMRDIIDKRTGTSLNEYEGWFMSDTLSHRYISCPCDMNYVLTNFDMLKYRGEHCHIIFVNDSIGFLCLQGNSLLKIGKDYVYFHYEQKFVDTHDIKLPPFYKIEFATKDYPKLLQHLSFECDNNNWWLIGDTPFNNLQLLYHSSDIHKWRRMCFRKKDN